MKSAFLIFTLLFLSACVEQQTEIKADSEIVVEANTTTTVKTPTCKDQCQKDYCLDNDFYVCKKQETGCSYVAKVGPVLGKCNIECFEDTDCNWNQDCSETDNEFKIRFACVNVSDEEAHSRENYIKANISFR